MKKLSFFLMAMLFSVMSFAQEAIYTLDGTITGGSNGYADASSLTQGNIAWSVTGNTTMSPWRIGGKKLTNVDRALYSKDPLAYNIDKIEVTHGTANITVNSFKLIISDKANGAGETIDVAFKASATTTIDLPEGDYSNKYFKFVYNVTAGSDNKYVQFTGAKFYAALAEDAVKAPIIDGDADFISETEVTIEAEDDVTVYYTVDGTEPTTTSTVYTAPFTVEETTTVKAIAYRGETASFVTSATFTKATQVTCAEAAVEAMKVASNNAPSALTYVVYGYVTEVIDQTLSSGQQRFWVADTKNGGQVLQSYYCNVPQVLKVGDYVQMFGKLTKYNTNPQMKNGDVTLAEEPVIVEPTIECKDALDFGAVVYTDEVEGQTLEVTGYNLTSDITVTLSDDVFAVDQTTLPAEGGELVVTPVSPLAAGTHTATLTLTSGEATAEVTLTIVAKDVYTITWSVNGETSTTSVVEGDKLALPEAPEAPEACSEKVFVGWTAAEEVNADGSDITWVTAATVPAGDATYYAVFALQEGEGSLEEGNVTMKYAGSTTTNMAEGNNAEKVGLDANVWNVTADKGGHNNYPGLNKDGTIRLYRGDDTGTNSIIVSNEAVTIQSVTITCGTLNNVKVLVNGNEVIASNGSYAINASSFVVTNGNTSGTTQVHIASIVINYTSGASATYTDYSTTCEPEVIEYVLNGGVLPLVGPTNAELWGTDTADVNGLMHYFNHYHNLKRSAQDISADVSTNPVATFLTGMPDEAGVFVDEESKYKWLGDYIVKVTNDQIAEGKLSVLKAVDSNVKWRYGVQAFFMCLPATDSNYKGWADFTEAGKPENWVNVYPDAKEVELPTEPVEEDYVLPTPTKSGSTFKGWYNNAEGTGDAYTVIPAGWAGTLYAIWKQGTTTALENIAVEGKAVKAIINGQLIIIKNGVQYNAQGQVVK